VTWREHAGRSEWRGGKRDVTGRVGGDVAVRSDRQPKRFRQFEVLEVKEGRRASGGVGGGRNQKANPGRTLGHGRLEANGGAAERGLAG
jgi:hypothetical protein